jgi:hypothetical protein
VDYDEVMTMEKRSPINHRKNTPDNWDTERWPVWDSRMRNSRVVSWHRLVIKFHGFITHSFRWSVTSRPPVFLSSSRKSTNFLHWLPPSTTPRVTPPTTDLRSRDLYHFLSNFLHPHISGVEICIISFQISFIQILFKEKKKSSHGNTEHR